MIYSGLDTHLNLRIKVFVQGIGVAKKVYDPDVWRLVPMLGSFNPKELIAGPPRRDVTFSPIIMGVLYTWLVWANAAHGMNESPSLVK